MATADDIQAGDDDGDDDELAPVAPAKQASAKPAPARPAATAVRSYRGIKIASFIGFVLLGWLFILGQNKFHVTAPVVFVCLGFLAVTTTVLNLWRTGAAAAAPDAADRDGEWERPLGAAAHLEKEKRTLLKAIKEAEFDLAMGKLSQADCDGLIRDYRARAIEVIKELDRLDQVASPTALSTRDQIAREVKARLALDEQNKPSNRAKNAAAKRAGKTKGRGQAEPAEAGSTADSKSPAGEPS
jgi:F0F1-type ATP synthase assembly protein I